MSSTIPVVASQSDLRGPSGSLMDQRMGPLYLLRVLRKAWLLVFVLPLLAGIAAFGVASLLKPTFTAVSRILSPQQQSPTAALMSSLSGIAGTAAGGAGFSGLRNPVDQWVSLLRSRTIADALIERFELKRVYDTELMVDTRGRLANNTRISGGKDNLITIEVDDYDPKLAAAMANAYVDKLQDLSKQLAMTEAAQRRLFFEGQMEQVRDNLVKAELALKQSGVNSSVVKMSPEATVQELGQLNAQIVAAEVRVAALRSSMAEGTPELIQAQSQLNSLRSQLRRTERSSPDASRSGGAQYVERYREFKYQETLFELMARQFELAKADEAREGAIIQVVDAAVLPERKSKPRRGLIAASTSLLFMLLGIGIALWRDVAAAGRAEA